MGRNAGSADSGGGRSSSHAQRAAAAAEQAHAEAKRRQLEVDDDGAPASPRWCGWTVRHPRWAAGIGAALLLACIGGLIGTLVCHYAVSCPLWPWGVSHSSSGSSGSGGSGAAVRSGGGGGGGVEVGEPGAGACPPVYARGGNLPLLFGGVQGACRENCQPRSGTVWAEQCRLDTGSVAWGVCEEWQRPTLLQLARNFDDGAPTRLTPCEFANRLGVRTLWLMGDSHMKNLYVGLRCFLYDVWDTAKGECAAAADPAEQLRLHTAALYAPRHRSLREITEPRCVHLLTGGRVCFLHTVRGEVLVGNTTDKPGVLQIVQKDLAQTGDVFYATFGRWYVHGCDGFESNQLELMLERLGQHYDATRGEWPNVLFGVPPFDHTPACNASWNPRNASVCPPPGAGSNVTVFEAITNTSHAVLEKHSMRLIDYSPLSVPLNMSHVTWRASLASKLDCLHFCRPGLPEIEAYSLHKALGPLLAQTLAPPATAPARECRAIDPI